MLSSEEISNWIKDPNTIGTEDLTSLEELTTKYPYTHLFSVLYLKALSKAGNVQFDDKLTQHSYRIPDRIQLYHLIQDHTDLKATNDYERTLPPEIEIRSEKIPSDDLNRDSPSEQQELLIDLKREPKLPVEQDIDSHTEEIHTNKDALEESILHHSLAANYRLDDLTQEEEASIEHRNIQTSNKEESNTELEPSSFVGWLHANKNYVLRDNSDKKAINAVVEDFAEFDPSSELFGEVKKPKTEFFSPVKKAKKSLEESELPVSETLAKIHVMQGNYPQAISAYQQLSLAFPEKKIFFANLIEDLEKKIKTK